MTDVHARLARRARRVRLLDALEAGDGAAGAAGALIVAAAPELRAGADGELKYMPDPDLYYLTGYAEPEAVLVLCPAADEPFTLFVRPRDAERERWSGTRGGVDAAVSQFGADAAYPIDRFAAMLPQIVAGAAVLHVCPDTGRPEIDAAVRQTMAEARRTRPRSGRGPHTLTDSRVLLAPMRQRKDAGEILLMREAADITVDAFADTAAAIRGAAGEWQVEATLEYAFRSRGATGPAFPSIVAGGVNATVLHYVDNAALLGHGDLVLIDAGARHRMYCADVTRTFPVSGRFSTAQRDVYDIVLSAHDAALAEIAPGAPAGGMHTAALRVLIDGMIAIGLLSGSVEEIIERKEYSRYYPHRTSHWLGLDVHDVGDYAGADGSDVRLENGMVLTIEPGLYVPADDAGAPEALRGIGVRLEDDVLVVDGGCDVLTRGLPIRPADVEAMLSAE